jgi:hypothetical protein
MEAGRQALAGYGRGGHAGPAPSTDANPDTRIAPLHARVSTLIIERRADLGVGELSQVAQHQDVEDERRQRGDGWPGRPRSGRPAQPATPHKFTG